MQCAGLVCSIIDRDIAEASPPTAQLQEDHHPETEFQPSDPSRTRRYNRAKHVSGLIRFTLAILFTFIALRTGLTVWMEDAVRRYISSDFIVLLAFAALFGLCESLLTLPLRFYSGYVLEHRYHLSNQSRWKWFSETLKAALVGLPLAAIILVCLYAFLTMFGSQWWIPTALLVFLFSVVLARLAPVLLFPLFYKFRPLEAGPLKDRLTLLCGKAGMKISGVFVFDLSKNTKKANAAFAGIGNARRIILGDTLIANFTDDEIESIVAHELGHFRLHHIGVMILIGAVTTATGLFVTALLYEWSLLWFGFTSIETIAAMPLLGLWLALFSLVTTPVTNVISRSFERQADRYAVYATERKEHFVNALKKLARINLADSSPHPLVEFLFYSHPSITERIKMVEAL